MTSSTAPTRRNFVRHAVAQAAVLASPLPAAQPRGLKFYVHWDMDGGNGIFTREQSWYWEEGVRKHIAEEARAIFTAQVNAASSAALASGATELIVCDTHHGGGNLIQDRLLHDPRITYHYRSVGMEAGKRRWMPGLDETVAGLMLPGHHAKAGTPGAFLPHTWSGTWEDFTINGQSVGEIGIEACYAGYWDVPLIFVQGDESACTEAQSQFPGVVTSSVKKAVTAELAKGLDTDAAHRETGRGIAEAIATAKTGRLRPFKPSAPMTVTVRMTTVEAAAKAAARPGVRRIGDRTLEGRVERQCDVVRWLLGTGLDMAPQ